MIEADIDNGAGRFRTGLFAEGEIVVDENARAVAVPQASIVSFAGVEKVWVVQEEKARSKRVLTGRREAGLVEIVEGLQPGDVVLSDGQQGREGPVRITSAVSTDRATMVGE
jgi:hypothetical protein